MSSHAVLIVFLEKGLLYCDVCFVYFKGKQVATVGLFVCVL